MDEAREIRGLVIGGLNYQSKKERVSVLLEAAGLPIVVDMRRELMVKVWQRVTT
jgi:hypothetical protein